MEEKAEIELRVQIDEFLDNVVVVAHGEHLVYQEHKREVAISLLEIRIFLKFVPPLACGNHHEIPPDVGALNTGHGEQDVLNQISFLDFNGEGAQMQKALLRHIVKHLSDVLLVRLDERLVLRRNIVMV